MCLSSLATLENSFKCDKQRLSTPLTRLSKCLIRESLFTNQLAALVVISPLLSQRGGVCLTTSQYFVTGVMLHVTAMFLLFPLCSTATMLPVWSESVCLGSSQHLSWRIPKWGGTQSWQTPWACFSRRPTSSGTIWKTLWMDVPSGHER